MHTLTRRALFDLVWDRPLTKIAAEFGISSVALHKICDKHRVPMPGRGYWAKLAAGQDVARAIFREVADVHLNEVRIFGSPIAQLPPTVAAARATARARLREHPLAKAPAVDQPTPSFDAQVNDAPGAAQPLHALHPVVDRLRRKLAGRRADATGLISFTKPRLPAVNISPEAVERAVSLLDLLLARSIAAGYKVIDSKEGFMLSVDGERISLRISERLDRVPHVLTTKEEADLRRWEADKLVRQKRGTYYSDWDKPRIPETDQVANGLLVFGIDQGDHWDGLQRNFGDTKRRRLEDSMDSVLAGMAACATARKEKRVRDEAQKRQWEEDAWKRKDQERRVTLHNKRCEFLDLQIEQLARVKRLRAFANDYQAEFGEIVEPTASLVLFATLLADHLRNQISPEALAPILEKHDLMNDDAEVSNWVSFKENY
ncbi:hypothetical protein [Dongia sp.]|uniref:hypothetical protein n=1 Tax=Dongia sp. TaxID=1977262 RepID=UPI0035B2697A